MPYLTSNNVVVFPIAKERTVSETRLLTEHNLSSIIRQLLSETNPGFITSTVHDKDNNIWNIVFNLYGYNFDIKLSSDFITSLGLTTTDDGIYAAIILDTAIDEIIGQDNTKGEYEGLQILTKNQVANKILDLKTNQKLVHIKILSHDLNGLREVQNGSFFGYSIGGLDGKWNA